MKHVNPIRYHHILVRINRRVPSHAMAAASALQRHHLHTHDELQEKTLYSLELADYPETLEFKKEVVFKVDASDSSDRD